MLTGSQRKFCEGVAVGTMSNTDAYLAAYPNSSREAARRSASDLLAREEIENEIQDIRNEAARLAGGAVLTIAEKRSFIARVVRCKVSEEPKDSDLWNSIRITEDGEEYKLPDKLKAIALDNDLAGEGSEAQGHDALRELLVEITK